MYTLLKWPVLYLSDFQSIVFMSGLYTINYIFLPASQLQSTFFPGHFNHCWFVGNVITHYMFYSISVDSVACICVFNCQLQEDWNTYKYNRRNLTLVIGNGTSTNYWPLLLHNKRVMLDQTNTCIYTTQQMTE